MAKKTRKVPLTSGPSAGGFGALLRAKGLEASAAEEATAATVESAVEADGLVGWPRAVLRIERKGRGGRTVTRVEGLPEAQLAELARAMRRGLGLGTSVDALDVVVQGDQRERVAAWLTAEGVKRVVT